MQMDKELKVVIEKFKGEIFMPLNENHYLAVYRDNEIYVFDKDGNRSSDFYLSRDYDTNTYESIEVQTSSIGTLGQKDFHEFVKKQVNLEKTLNQLVDLVEGKNHEVVFNQLKDNPNNLIK